MKNKLIILIFIIIFLVGTLSYSLGLFSGGGAQASSLEKGLVAWYPLNGEYGTKDATPNANHGTNNGATLSTGRKGEANGSYSFDESNIDLSSISDTGTTHTISMWIKSTSDERARYFFDTSDGRILLGWGSDTAGKIGLYDGTWRLFGNTPSSNVWHLVIFTMNGTTNKCKMYLDGIQYGSELDYTPRQLGGIIKLGSRNSILGNWYYFTGSISDVRIYNRVLEEDEIKLLYDSFKPEIATSDLNKGLVGHWMLDSENGAKDLTPSENHGITNTGLNTPSFTTDRFGKENGALNFSSSNSMIDIPFKINNSNIGALNSQYTFSFWIKLDEYGPQGQSVIFGAAYYNGIGIKTSSDGSTYTRINAYFRNIDSQYETTYKSLELNKWYNVVIILDKPNLILKLYVDGLLIGTKSITSSSFTYLENLNFKINGINAPGGNGPWSNIRGSISDAKLYNRALSEDEIKLLYDQYKPKEASIGSLQKGLVLDMPLTTKHMKSSTVVSDRTPYGNDGTVVGATVGSQYTSFDGINDIIDMGILNPDLRNENFITISAWIKRETGSSGNSGLGITHSWWWEVGMTFDSNQLSIRLRNSDGTQNINTGLDLNYDWNFVTLTYNRLNGNWEAIVNNDYTSGFGIIASGGQGNFRVGCLGSNPNNYFKGQISNIKIYNRILSEEEIKLLYEKGRS